MIFWSKMRNRLKSSSEITVEGLLDYIKFNENPINNRDKRLHPFISEAIEILFEHNFNAKSIVEKVMLERDDMGLGEIFNRYQSDKHSRHSYAFVYAELIKKHKSLSLLEIGLGSTNGFPYGGLNPGGSIKAWREFSPECLLVGMDIDSEAVNQINEHGFVLDQTSSKSIEVTTKAVAELSPKFDLIIDDGFHDIHANIRTYLGFQHLLSTEGTYVIEDVHSSLVPFWALLAPSLPGKMRILDLSFLRPDTDDNVLILFTPKD
jgi:hypothetical protein